MKPRPLCALVSRAPARRARAKLASFGSLRDGAARRRPHSERPGALFAELHSGLALASTSAGTERAGWHLHWH